MNVLFGGIVGFGYFLYKLEAPGMGNILFRVNSDGIKEFSLDSLLNIMQAPFKYSNFWLDFNSHQRQFYCIFGNWSFSYKSDDDEQKLRKSIKNKPLLLIHIQAIYI